MSFEQALSGLQAASQQLDVIGNNIANAQTVGYKDVRAEFSDVYASSLLGGSGNAVGIGVQVAEVQPEYTQGTISTTGNPLDIAINGNGFFEMSNNGALSYTRDGEFQLDANGNIVNAEGLNLMGYAANAAGVITGGTPTALQLSTTPVAPAATTTASVSANLDSTDTPITAAFNMNDSTTYNSATSMTVYDSLGNSHSLTLYYTETAADTWNVYGSVDGTVLNAGKALTTLTFNSSGLLASGTSATAALTIPVTTGANTIAATLTFPYASTTQYGSPFAVSSNTQNGYTTGELSSFSIDSTGVITGSYSNGQTLALGQVALATFTNPQGLIAESNNQFVQSAASGAPSVGTPGSGDTGTVQSGALEQSTVDITTELVNMITAQRVYQANAETVKTEDQVEQTLMNLR